MLKPSFARIFRGCWGRGACPSKRGKSWQTMDQTLSITCAVVKAAMALGASVFAFTHELL